MSGSLVVPRGAELCFLPLAAPSPGQNQAHGRAGSVLCPPEGTNGSRCVFRLLGS